MKLGNLSTFALNNNLRLQFSRMQHSLVDAHKEVVTGQKADIGYSLGAFSSSTVTIENQIGFIEQTRVTNSFVENRLSTMQLSMNAIIDDANEFISLVLAEVGGPLDKDLLSAAGQSTLAQFTGTLNVSLGGEYLFSGINSDSEAIYDYQGASGSAAKTAVQNAFFTEFGFAVSDPSAASITPAAIKAFVDGAYADLFNDANWDLLWTGSSDRGMRSKISTRELVENPTTANVEAFRNFTAASVLMEEFADGNLNSSALDEVANSSVELMAQSISEIATEQSKVGVIEERVSSATERLEFQKDILSSQKAQLTDVDSYEAATRLNQIVAGIEASYAATVKVQSLSILNFI